MSSSVRIAMVGDVLVDRADPATPFRHVKECFADADLVFGNCEGVFSDRITRPPATNWEVVAEPHNVEGLQAAGFDVMACANNHIMDGGVEGMLDTMSRLQAAGITPVGTGENLAKAWAPAVCTVGDTRIGVVAFASMFAVGTEARENQPGLAPVRAYNIYHDALPNNWQPGAIPVVTTHTDERDLAALAQSIRTARESSDVVLVSAHWGDWARPAVVTDHERRTAHAAIDAGADIVVGHHHHLLRGVEWYGGKPILYGLGHFVFDLGKLVDQVGAENLPVIQEGEVDDYYGLAPRPGWPRLPMHPDSRMTAIAWADVARDGTISVGILPCRINPEGEVEPHGADTALGRRILEYVGWTCDSEGLPTDLARGKVRLGGHQTADVRQRLTARDEVKSRDVA
jgi:poly-gamma-glutamate capsule biosynthesis protein CapA/YwtB (metallophosphatase superfamily)